MNNPQQKQQIKQAAMQIFSEKGYSGATIAEIAAHAGVNPATIYGFFSGKKNLFESLQRPDLDFPDQKEKNNRDVILRAALKIFSQKGYATATMDDIAETVGISKAGIYFYFSSKESLFLTALENPTAFSTINMCLQSILTIDDANLEKGLVNLSKVYLSLFMNDEFVSLLRVILSEGTRNLDISTAFQENIVKRGSENVARYLQKFCNLEPDELIIKVQALFGMLFSWGILNFLFTKENEIQKTNIDLIAREYVHQFLFGFNESYIRKNKEEVR
jgi:TetR/AcrR family transcriptional regulator, mexJK operon transcriptional repressor